MSKLFKHPVTGAPSLSPWTVEQAKAAKRVRVRDDAGCAVCNTAEYTTRFIDGGVCFGCHVREAHALYRMLQGPFTATEAAARGMSFYYGQPSGEPACFGGAHVAETDIETGKCRVCEEKKTPRDPARAEARAAGYWEYVPSRPCPDCGKQALREVGTNKCSGCAGERQDMRRSSYVRTQTEGLDAANAVLLKSEAKGLDLAVFRTGKPCTRGHVTCRYVSTGNCVACVAERR